MKTFDCVTVGSCVLDTFTLLKTGNHQPDKHKKGIVDQCLALGAKIDVEKIVQQSGGGASNAAVTFARQRLSVAIISKVGQDPASQLVLDELKDERVSTTYIHKIANGKTGQSVVLIDPNAERTVLTDRGSAGSLTAVDLEVLDEIKARWMYVTSLNGSIESLDCVFNWAIERGVKIAWNPGLRDVEKHMRHINRLIAHVSLLIVNKEEAGLFCGMDSGSVESLAHKLHEKGVIRGVITDGSQKLAIIDGNKTWNEIPNTLHAIDQTGAGDACGSGIVSGLLQGLSFKESLQLGLSNAEHVIMHVGAKTGILYRK